MKKNIVEFEDFQKLDLRVGKVLKAENVEGSINLIRMQVDLGLEYGERKILAGLAKYYKPKDLKGKKFIFVANLAPKQMLKEQSNGMILVGDLEQDIKIVPVNKNIPEGTIVR
jgi:methionine--tRNA ligase beta chain